MSREWEDRPISEVHPYPGNPRKNDSAVEATANSIREFGWQQPIVVDEDGTIIAGHTRYKAAKRLGMTTVPVHVARGLTPEQVAAYRLADNKTGELAEWDDDALALELDGLLTSDIDMGDFGFELDSLGEGQPDASEVRDVEPDDEAESRVSRGEVWALGRHRLMCGDSTDADAVATLMGGRRADVCFTSPPYNLARDGAVSENGIVSHTHGERLTRDMRGGHAYGDCSDDMSDDDYASLLTCSVSNALAFCDDAMFNVGIIKGSKHGVIRMLYEHVDEFNCMIAWNKANSLTMGLPSQRGVLSNRVEPIFCFNSEGSRAFSHPQWQVGTGLNRIDTPNASRNEYSRIHSATFPIELPTEVITNFCEPDGSVLDLFGGTGTTMIAAEQLGRACYMMELDPHYCNVILDRWERLAGLKAERVG